MHTGWRRTVGATTVLWVCAAAARGPVAADTLPAADATSRCALVLSEHRTARELLRVGWPSGPLRVSFVHSVLGTTVEDFYVWREHGWVLVEERFQGQGYGLPHVAASGERLETDGDFTRLLLNRSVMPLVIRPLPAQAMRVHLADGRQWRLADLSANAIELRLRDC